MLTVTKWKSGEGYGAKEKAIEGVGLGHNAVTRFFNRYIRAMMLFFPLTSFLLIPSIQGTTVIAVMAGILSMVLVSIPVGPQKFLFMKELFVLFCVAAFFSITTQFINLIYNIKLNDDLVLINTGKLLKIFYRTSHITQTLYLISCFIIYLFVKYFADEKIIDYIYWGLRILCFYAIYEWAYFLLTGEKGDFITNRTFSEGGKGSLSQTTQIGGLTLLRMKGYTGEPSMFSFTIIPFWILAWGLKRRFDLILLLVCMVLTFSTTSYMSIVLFLGFWFIYKKKYKQLVYFGLLVLVVLIILQTEAFRPVLDNIYDKVFEAKISGESSSSKGRLSRFYTHLDYWSNLNGVSQLFGIGFGYIRSTDFLTTVLVNNGILGLLLFSAFVLRSFFFKIEPEELGIFYKAGICLVYFAMLTTVPEFSYPSFWVYLALGFVLQKKRKSEQDYPAEAAREKSSILRPAALKET